MSRKQIVPFFFALALLTAAAFFARAPIAVASTDAPGAKSPSVVMQAFRQTQVGEGPNRAALVVQYADGSVQTRCVAFSENELGGDELLERSGLTAVIGVTGEVCSINGQGCSVDECFCECPFPECEYWAYYHWGGSDWLYSDVGAAFYTVMNGDLEGWSWGEGDFSQGTPPPLMTFEQICPTEAAAPAPQVSFLATQTTITQGECAALNWQTTNATTVLLDNEAVDPNGTRQVCPQATQTWTLVAGSAAGQTTRAVTITVNPAGTGAAATATWTPSPTATTGAAATSPTVAPTVTPENVVRSGMPTPPVYATPFPQAFVTQAPGAVLQPGQVGGFPTPSMGFSPLATSAFVGGVPLAPTAEPVMQESMPQAPQGPLPTSTRFVFARPATETPRPRRILDDGRPTPTPILVARSDAAAPGSGASAAEGAGAGFANDADSPLVASSRAFSEALLPQYAGYLAILTILLALGWLAQRRRNGPAVAPQAAPVAERPRGDRLAARDERAAQ